MPPYQRISDKHLEEVKEHLEKVIKLEIKDIVEKVEKHEKCLYGENGMSGICRDNNNMKFGFTVFQWFLGFLGIGFLINLFKR